MRKKWMIALLCVLLTASVVGTGISAFAAADLGDQYVYIRTADFSNCADRGGTPQTAVENFNDEYSGGTNVDNKTVLLQAAGDYVAYDIDLNAAASSATAAIYGSGVKKISVLPEGDTSYIDILPKDGATPNRGVNFFDLSASNALKGESNRFRLKVGYTDAAVVMNGIAVKANTFTERISEGLEIATVSENELKYMTKSTDNISRYFDGNVPMAHYNAVNGAAYTEYRFQFANEVEEVSIAGAVNNNPSATPVFEYAVDDGTSYTEIGLSGRANLSGSTHKVLNLRLINKTNSDQVFVKKFTVNPVMNANANLIEIHTDGAANELNYLVGESGTQIYADDGAGALGSSKTNIRLMNGNGGYLTYSFDLADDVQKATLNSVGGGLKALYSVNGTDFAELTATASSSEKYGVQSFALTAANALSNANRQFYIKFQNNNAGQVILHSLAIMTDRKIETEDIVLSATTAAAGLKYFAGGEVLTYFADQSPEKLCYYMKPGKQMILRFSLDKTVFSKVDLLLGANNENPAISHISFDGASFQAYHGAPVNMADSASGELYVKVTNGAGDTMISSVAVKKNSNPAVGINGNTQVPANTAEAFFSVGTDGEKSHMFGTGSDYEANFAATHRGLAADGHEGGNSVVNARKMNAGDYLAYDFDLSDGVTSAKLKLYATAGIKVMVSTDEGAAYTTLSTEKKPSGDGRGYCLYDLTSSDALKRADKKFRLAISATAEAYVFSGGVFTEETSPLERGAVVLPQSGESLRYLSDAKNVATYYSNGSQANLFFKHADSFAVYRFDFAADVRSAVFFINQSADVKAEASGDGVSYAELFKNQLGGTGEQPVTTYDVSSYLGANQTVYIKISNGGTGGFVQALGISVTPKDEISGSFTTFSGEENYLYDILKTSEGYGAMVIDNRFVKKLSGEAIYRFDLDDAATAVKFTFAGLSGQASVWISKDGANYRQIGTASGAEKSFTDYRALRDNAGNVVYLKLKASGEGTYDFDGFSFTTQGIPEEGNKDKPYGDGDVSFDYDKTLPGRDTLGQPGLGEPAGYGEKVAFNKALVIGLSVGGGSLVLAGGAFAALWFLVIKKKIGGKKS